MWRAALPVVRRRVVLVWLGLVAIATAVTPLAAGSATDGTRSVSMPYEMWAVGLGRETASVSTSLLERLRGNHINTLVVDPAIVTGRKLSRLRRRAERVGLTVLTPIASPELGLYGPPDAATAICRAEKARHPGRLCAVRGSLATAERLVAQPDVDVVVADVRGPRDVRYLAGV